MLRTLVGLAMLWTVQAVGERCSVDSQCSAKQECTAINGGSTKKCWCPGMMETPQVLWKGDECNCNSDVTCSSRGRCSDAAISVCECYPHSFGPHCDIYCKDEYCQGRGTCNQDGSCACVGDWTGPKCECSPSETCNGNGACDPSTLKCTCAPGWTGVYCNIECTPRAPGVPCDSQGTCGTDQDCGQNQHCDDTSNCLCNPGFIGANCDEPCTLCGNNGHCDPKTPYGLPCICDANHYGSYCKTFCDDAQCGHGKCHATGACECDGDWVDWKGATCDCSPSVTCSGNGKCEGVSSKCKCDNGWLGTACDVPCDPATTCSGHGTCVPHATEPCQCEPNWHNKDCSVFCTPSTTCSGNGVCLGDGSCKCSANWFGKDCAVYCNPSTTCTGLGVCLGDGSCKCSAFWFGKDCAVHCNPSTTCSGNGVCLGGASCKCSGNWMGANCDQCSANWMGKDCAVFCDPATTCSGNGACLPDGSCKCSANWMGKDCAVFCDPATTCTGHGVCLGDGSCKCSTFWSGKDCAVHCNPSTTCSGNGACLADGSCKCSANWMGTNCDQCSANWMGKDCAVFCDPATTCTGHGVCLGDASCKCSANWFGKDCSSFCNPSMCHSRGTCDATTGRCKCDQGFDAATHCQMCLPHYYGHHCEVHCTDDVTCHGNGQCDASGKCQCEAKYSGTTDCGRHASIYGDPHYTNVDGENYDFHGVDPSGYYAYTDDEVSVTTWNYRCDDARPHLACVGHVAILQKSNGDMLEFKRKENTGMQTSVKLMTSCGTPFMTLASWTPSIALPSSMRYSAPIGYADGVSVSLLDAAGRVKMVLSLRDAGLAPNNVPLSYSLQVKAVVYEKGQLDGERGSFFLEGKNKNAMKKSAVTKTCLAGRSAAVLNTDEATITIPTVAEELRNCPSNAAREHALECCAPGKACGTWYAQCLFEACLHHVPGSDDCADVLDSLMFKEQGSNKSCFCPSETMTPDHVSQTCSLCQPHYYPLPGPGVAAADACATRCTSEDCPEESPYCNSRGECSTAEQMRQREGKHTPALAESAWAYHLPSDKHPCAPGKALGRLVELREVLTPENVGPLTFGDEAIMIEARVRMRNATNWARIVDFGNGAKGSVVFGQRRLSKKLGFETHSFDACSTAQGRRVNSSVALPEDEDVWTWVAFTLTKEGVATMYHNNEPVIQVSGVALPEFGTRVKNYVRTPKKRSGDGWDGDIEYLTFSTCFVRSPVLPSEWHFNLPKAKHPCVPGEVLGRIVQVDDVPPGGSDVGPLTFGDGAIMIEARVQMRNATKWASIIDFGNGAAKGSVVFGQRSVSKKLSFESHPFKTCSTQNDTRDVNSRVALPEDEDAWTWVAFTLTKDGVATIYHNNEPVTQVSGVALPEFGTRVKNYVRGSHSSGDDGKWDGAIRHLSVSTCSVPDASVMPIPPVVIPH